MKKILIIITFLILSPFISFSQIIDDVDIREIKSEFIEVVFKGHPNLYGLIVRIKINYGFSKKLKVFRKKSNVIYDGEKVVLKTENDVINFFSSYGYEVINEMDRSRSGGITRTHYIGNKGYVSGSSGTMNQITIRFQNNNN